jgi:ABC-2 type transport system permease protein
MSDVKGVARRGHPAPAPEPAGVPPVPLLVWRQYRLERRLFWRNPSAAFFNLGLPLLFLAFFGAIFAGDQDALDVIVPGIAGMSVLSATFTALAHNMVSLREQGVLKRMHGTPLPPGAYLGGLAAHAVTNTVVQVGIVLVAGNVLFGVDGLRDPVELLVFLVVGVVCFASLGVAFSHVIPNSDSAPAYVNAVFLPVVFISGVFYDADDAPSFLRDIADILPLTHLIDGLTAAMVDGTGLGHQAGALAVLGVWTAFGVFFAIRGFSWESKRA